MVQQHAAGRTARAKGFPEEASGSCRSQTTTASAPFNLCSAQLRPGRLPIVTVSHIAHPDPGSFRARTRCARFFDMLYIRNGLVTASYSDYILPHQRRGVEATQWCGSFIRRRFMTAGLFDQHGFI